jgi:hypothetical protein
MVKQTIGAARQILKLRKAVTKCGLVVQFDLRSLPRR